ncbi:MAG: dihydropteroate synthase [Bacteroidales bacterium]|nr:dihydropteroate synthase [Bacteroidales bacterium]
MGILNLSMDSFFEGNSNNNIIGLIDQTKKMLDEGAKIIDIGAVSTRPGAKLVSEEMELKSLLMVIPELIKNFPKVIFSVDTVRANIAEKVIEAGADMINDISGGTMDDKMFETIASLQVPYVLMHIQGTPQNMQDDPKYENVVLEIEQFFLNQINKLERLGFSQIILDPGFGFGKTLEHNYKILKNIKLFTKLGFPVLAGVSRKSMINKVLKTTPKTALNGTTVLNTIAVLNGAKILRVHDVKEAVEVIKLCEQLSD